jgi:hypothetical protein
MHDASTSSIYFTVVFHITTIAHNNVQNIGFQGYSSAGALFGFGTFFDEAASGCPKTFPVILGP